jgi:hypothetical protein
VLADGLEVKGDVATTVDDVGLGAQPNRRAEEIDRVSRVPEQRGAIGGWPGERERGRGDQRGPAKHQRAPAEPASDRGHCLRTALAHFFGPVRVRGGRQALAGAIRVTIELGPERAPARGTGRLDGLSNRERGEVTPGTATDPPHQHSSYHHDDPGTERNQGRRADAKPEEPRRQREAGYDGRDHSKRPGEVAGAPERARDRLEGFVGPRHDP